MLNDFSLQQPDCGALTHVPHLAPSTTPEQVVGHLQRYGCVIVDRLAPTLVQRAGKELDPHLARAPFGAGDFVGRRTRRVSSLIARSEACRELAIHPLPLGASHVALRGQCYHPQLSATSAIDIAPGERAQSLHRDDGVFPFAHPRPPCVINTLWAITPFTEDNGATRFVLGSHLWDDATEPSPEQTVSATMQPGSLLLWDAAVYHGGGANTSSSSRIGASFAYSLGWLRQYENQFLAVPPELARRLSPVLQGVLGYRTHGFLGTHENRDPRAVWEQTSDAPLAAEDLFTDALAKARPKGKLVFVHNPS